MRLEAWQGLLALLAAGLGGGGIAGLFRVRSLNRKDDANSAVLLAGAYAKLIDQLEHRIKSLELENSELRVRVLHLEERLDGRRPA